MARSTDPTPEARYPGLPTETHGRSLVVVSGPSGAGKTTVVRRVAERLGLAVSTSATTRPRREGEVDGEDYWFIDEEEFKARAAAGRFVEWAEVFGRYYGTPVEEIERARAAGTLLILEIDVQGGLQIKKKYPEALAILLVPPGDDALQERLTGRGTESEEELEKRLAAARKEIETAHESGLYDKEIVNDELAMAVDAVAAAITRWAEGEAARGTSEVEDTRRD